MKAIPAVFEHGVFRPKIPVSIPSGSELDIFISEESDDPVEIMRARYPGSFGGFSPEEAEEIASSINSEFERINPDAWKLPPPPVAG